MNVLVVGSGGREHVLVWKLSRESGLKKIVCCPGNPGIAELATCLPVNAGDTEGILAACTEHSIDLVVFGPEEPLVNGSADWLRRRGVAVFGPSASAAELEGSKVFSKLFMRHEGIPTAQFEVFDSYDEAREYVSKLEGPVVVKADGLARGKGVFVCEKQDEASNALRQIMVDRTFGTAGDRVVVEERICGDEISVMAICDGKQYVLLPCSQDHKRAFDGDKGPNTGGMGAYCPVPLAGKEVLRVVESLVIGPVLAGMEKVGRPFVGILYAGLMLTEEGPKVLEFNCRFGDPEAQTVLPLCDIELGELLLEAAHGRLARTQTIEADCASVCVVACSGGYPGLYDAGRRIKGLEKLRGMEGVLVFHAGTKKENEILVSAGGRVLDIVGLMPNLSQAITKAYEAVEMVRFEGMHYRKDIGARATPNVEAS